MSRVVHAFTAKVPVWSPYVTPVDPATATPEQMEAMQVTPSNKGISPYVLTLAHDPESLAVRSPLFNQIMYGKDGLTSAERELGAVGASVVNRCIYCAAVHASRFNGLTKRPEVMDAIFRDERDARLEPRTRRSSTSPPGFPDAPRTRRGSGRDPPGGRPRHAGSRGPRLRGRDLRLGQPPHAYVGRTDRTVTIASQVRAVGASNEPR